MVLCTPHAADDISVAACEQWCEEQHARDHCRYCKCASCSFCPPPSPPSPPRPPPLPFPPGAANRLTARGTQLWDEAGRPVVLQGVNFYLEWYKDTFAAVRAGSGALDVAHLRRALPAANVVRIVGLLWKDSVKASDGLECSSDDASRGYLDPVCVRFLDALIKQATDAGLWVILAARCKYAAGWDLRTAPDVFHDEALRRRFYAMWAWVARRHRFTERIAGYEVMSEPRTKTVAQARVRDVMRGACEAVHEADPRALCVVGPRPYYKLWEMTDDVLQPPGSNTLYTFDFFVPKDFVMGDTMKERERYCNGKEGCYGNSFPASYTCSQIYDTWWRGKPGCRTADSRVKVDAEFVRRTLETYAVGFARRHEVPVHCNQWGVKAEVLAFNGRLRYAQAALDAFKALSLSSTYWIWRSYAKPGRNVAEVAAWGFELLHNDGPHEQLDVGMLGVLQAGFEAVATASAGTAAPCGLAAARVPPVYNVTPALSTLRNKAWVMHNLESSVAGRPAQLRVVFPPLPPSGVECDPFALEARVDWSVLRADAADDDPSTGNEVPAVAPPDFVPTALLLAAAEAASADSAAAGTDSAQPPDGELPEARMESASTPSLPTPLHLAPAVMMRLRPPPPSPSVAAAQPPLMQQSLRWPPAVSPPPARGLVLNLAPPAYSRPQPDVLPTDQPPVHATAERERAVLVLSLSRIQSLATVTAESVRPIDAVVAMAALLVGATCGCCFIRACSRVRRRAQPSVAVGKVLPPPLDVPSMECIEQPRRGKGRKSKGPQHATGGRGASYAQMRTEESSSEEPEEIAVV